METSTSYQKHVQIMKNLELHSDYEKVREPYKDDFETIYEEAKESDIKLSNAKEFLNDLDSKELSTLQNYARLVDEISVDELSDEGAYNLLMHFYEKYDFDNDGITEVGKGKNISMIPQNMEDDLKEAFVNALNSSDEDDMLSMMVLTFDLELLKHHIAEDMKNMSESQKSAIREHASFDIDKFIEETLKTPYHPKTITFEDIVERIDKVLNPEDTEYSSPEFQESMEKFSQTLQNEYQKIKESKAQEQKESILVNELIQKNETQESTEVSNLASLLQAG